MRIGWGLSNGMVINPTPVAKWKKLTFGIHRSWNLLNKAALPDSKGQASMKNGSFSISHKIIERLLEQSLLFKQLLIKYKFCLFNLAMVFLKTN